MKLSRVLGGVGVALGAVAARDLTQKKHALMRNYPVIAHARYWLETIGPELRQYIVTSNDEERPFSRDQRSWIYASSKQENNYSGFGTDNDVEHLPGYAIIKHRTFAGSLPHDHAATTGLPSAKVLGGPRGRAQAFRPDSLINISAMSFGSMSANAIKALNAGAAQAGCMHNTGEGGLSPHHRQGGDIMLQIGTAYFGCRDEDGNFSLDKLKEVVESAPVQGHRDQALAGRQAGPRRAAAGRQGDQGDLRDPRHPDGPATAPARRGTPPSATRTACSTSSSCWPPRPALPVGIKSCRRATCASGTSSPG